MYLAKIFRPRESILIALQAISLLAFVWAIFHTESVQLWIASLFGWFLITCLGITVTFHRLLAHRSYQLWLPFEALFSFFGNMGCTGSSVGWVYIHRKHHVYSDQKGDPHSPKTLGAIGAIVGDYKLESSEMWRVRDILKRPLHRFFHDYHFLIMFILIFALFLISIETLIHWYFVPVFLNVFVSRFSNWIDHTPAFGKNIFETGDDSRNVWWWSILSFGEGWHNNHHSDPGNYRIGRTFLEFDPGKYVIEACIFIGLAKDKINLKKDHLG